ncbi:MAG: rhodanese-like domain-containing protein, partial [Firmicutes bacterium]|nr:rhodanese-like domain-containing protein [Bacillota bacterium]
MRDLRSIGLDHVVGIAPLQVVNDSTAGALETYQDVTPTEAKSLIDSGQAVLVDVRNDAEWAEGSIEGAQHVMLG